MDAPVHIDSNSQTDIPKFAPKKKRKYWPWWLQLLGLLLEQSSLWNKWENRIFRWNNKMQLPKVTFPIQFKDSLYYKKSLDLLIEINLLGL